MNERQPGDLCPDCLCHCDAADCLCDIGRRRCLDCDVLVCDDYAGPIEL